MAHRNQSTATPSRFNVSTDAAAILLALAFAAIVRLGVVHFIAR